MNSNAEHDAVELFATWTSRFQTALAEGGSKGVVQFAFLPDATGIYSLHDLFNRSGRGERHFEHLVNAFLSLGERADEAQWVATTALLGPLFIPDPYQASIDRAVLSESRRDWLEGSRLLKLFWSNLERLSEVSSAPLSAEERRQEGLEQLGISPERVSPGELEILLEAFMPREWESDATRLDDEIGNHLRQRFTSPAPPIMPVLHPHTKELQIVVRQGIQALFIMSMVLARKHRGSFPRACARPNCTMVAFMPTRKRFCSKPCQVAAKQQKYRRSQARAKAQVS